MPTWHDEHVDDIVTLQVAFEVTATYGERELTSTLTESDEKDYTDVWLNVADHFGYAFAEEVWPYITEPKATEDQLYPDYRASHVRAKFTPNLLGFVRGFANWSDEDIVDYVERIQAQVRDKEKLMISQEASQAAIAMAHEAYDAFCTDAGNFTCAEAEVVAEFLRQWHTQPEVAERFLEAHALGDDDENDLHYQGGQHDN